MRRNINLLFFYFNQKRSFTLKRLIYEPLDIYQTYSYCYFFLFIETLKKTATTKFTLFNKKQNNNDIFILSLSITTVFWNKQQMKTLRSSKIQLIIRKRKKFVLDYKLYVMAQYELRLDFCIQIFHKMNHWICWVCDFEYICQLLCPFVFRFILKSHIHIYYKICE